MGNRLSKIYTRTGDDGSTGLGDGSRVGKDSARVEAYGTVDEANSCIGLVRLHTAGNAALDAMLGMSPRPTAVFAHNDALALGVIEAMRHRGLRYPEDLAIVGFNNTHLSRVLAVPLSTVDYPVEDVSRHAGELVRNLIDNPSYRFESRLFVPSLIVRASS